MAHLIVQALWLSALSFIVGWMLFSLAYRQYHIYRVHQRLDRRVRSLRKGHR